MALGLGGDAHVVAARNFVADIGCRHDRGKAEDTNDGVGAGIAEPVLFKRAFVVQGWSRSRGGTGEPTAGHLSGHTAQGKCINE